MGRPKGSKNKTTISSVVKQTINKKTHKDKTKFPNTKIVIEIDEQPDKDCGMICQLCDRPLNYTNYHVDGIDNSEWETNRQPPKSLFTGKNCWRIKEQIFSGEVECRTLI